MRAFVVIAASSLVLATCCKDPECAPRERPDAASAAFEEIETMTRYVRRQGNKGLGLDDQDGHTQVLLLRILDSPNASDYLVRLAHSKNTVSRMAAAEG